MIIIPIATLNRVTRTSSIVKPRLKVRLKVKNTHRHKRAVRL